MLDNSYIAELISKHTFGTISEEEQTELNQWLSVSDRNGDILSRFEDSVYVREYLESLNSIDPAESWIVVSKRRKQLLFRNALKRTMRYAASIAAFALLFSAIYYFVHQERQVAHDIKQLDGVTLTLHDGKTINLQKDTDDQAIAVGVNVGDNVISYANADSHDEASSASPQYHKLHVPRGTSFTIELADGSTVMLNAESELLYPLKFTGDKREVILHGEGYFNVAHNIDRPFIVKALDVEIKVLGTKFNVSNYQDDACVRTTLVDGAVNVSIANGKAISLTPGQQAVWAKNSNDITKHEVDITQFTSWTTNLFSMRQEKLQNIMKVFERWYGVDVVFESENAKNLIFGFSIDRDAKLEEIMKSFESTGHIKVNIKENTVYINASSL